MGFKEKTLETQRGRDFGRFFRENKLPLGWKHPRACS